MKTNRLIRRTITIIFCRAIFLSAMLGCLFRIQVATATDYGISNPVLDDKKKMTTWDCVYFGNYFQSSETNKEPIKWRVLSVNGDDAFLLADQNLESKPYNTTCTAVTWETCTLRSWLNGYGSDSNVEGMDYRGDNFLDTAFSRTEASAIRKTTVVYTMPAKNTEDKIYLLSLSEAGNISYGFYSIKWGPYSEGEWNVEIPADTRIATNTAHVAAANSYMAPADNADYWWLRSSGGDSAEDNNRNNRFVASYVYYNGYGSPYGVDVSVKDGPAVRPALHLDLSSSEWQRAGQVSAYWGSTEGEAKMPSRKNTINALDFPSTPKRKVKEGKNRPTKLNIKNKKRYSLKKKLTIKDADGIKSIKLNGRSIKLKKGKKSFSFKLSKYKKRLKKKEKWNKLVVTDLKGKKKMVQFKAKL